MNPIRRWRIRRRARAGLRFHYWMDERMKALMLNRQERNQMWRDFYKDPWTRMSVLNKLCVGLGMKVKARKIAAWEQEKGRLAAENAMLRIDLARAKATIEALEQEKERLVDESLMLQRELAKVRIEYADLTLRATEMAPAKPAAEKEVQ